MDHKLISAESLVKAAQVGEYAVPEFQRGSCGQPIGLGNSQIPLLRIFQSAVY